ncbi:MAG: hypothetical protein RLO50_00510 [Azospirillaceae bacterium]
MTHSRPAQPSGRQRRAARLAGVLLTLCAAACQGGTTGPAITGAAGTPIAPDRLTGLDEAGVTALLGPPDLARSEADIRILQFRATTCVADVYLYPAAEGGRVVTYSEARTTGGGSTDQAGCLGAIAARR